MTNIFVTVISFFSFFILTDSAKTYGLFNLSLKSFELCKGPKSKDCTVGTSNITLENVVSVDIVAVENAALEKTKVMSFIAENNQTLRMQFNKPCDNVFLKPIFQSLFNASSQCIVPKGRYKISMNFEEMFKKYYGGMYVYGTHIFKSLFYSNHCNFICTKIVLVLTPRN